MFCLHANNSLWILKHNMRAIFEKILIWFFGLSSCWMQNWFQSSIDIHHWSHMIFEKARSWCVSPVCFQVVFKLLTRNVFSIWLFMKYRFMLSQSIIDINPSCVPCYLKLWSFGSDLTSLDATQILSVLFCWICLLCAGGCKATTEVGQLFSPSCSSDKRHAAAGVSTCMIIDKWRLRVLWYDDFNSGECFGGAYMFVSVPNDHTLFWGICNQSSRFPWR